MQWLSESFTSQSASVRGKHIHCPKGQWLCKNHCPWLEFYCPTFSPNFQVLYRIFTLSLIALLVWSPSSVTQVILHSLHAITIWSSRYCYGGLDDRGCLIPSHMEFDVWSYFICFSAVQEQTFLLSLRASKIAKSTCPSSNQLVPIYSTSYSRSNNFEVVLTLR
jgi:hypothetical protein